ncbi:MAG: hypothetical protein ACYTDW_00755, partial [Planctomycetota bacterium]
AAFFSYFFRFFPLKIPSPHCKLTADKRGTPLIRDSGLERTYDLTGAREIWQQWGLYGKHINNSWAA